MKVYKVKVNGKVYEVELESVSEKEGTVVAPAKAEAPAPSTSQAPASGVVVKAPMQGTILKVNVEVGSQVQKGQCVAILEAMKLENEIVATASGTVKEINVSKGQTVNNQQAILVIG